VNLISNALRDLVRNRAGNRCEYCLLPEAFLVPHEPDHVIASQHGGPTSSENLALACFDCNRRKGPNISSVDPWTLTLARSCHSLIRDATLGRRILVLTALVLLVELELGAQQRNCYTSMAFRASGFERGCGMWADTEPPEFCSKEIIRFELLRRVL
jgi:hypothetical protein